MHIKLKINKKTIFTRRCIGEAIVSLLESAELEKLRVSAIVRRAGVARMTFYNYYLTPLDALRDYLNILISEFVESDTNDGVKLTYDHILYSIIFFDRYREYFLSMYKHGLYSILIDGMNEFMRESIQADEPLDIYGMYAYAGGLLNIFMSWELDGRKDDASIVAEKIYDIYRKE